MLRSMLLAGLVWALAPAATAQIDTLQVPVQQPDMVEVPADTVEVEADLDLVGEPVDDRAILAAPGPRRGPGITRVPTRAPLFSAAALLDEHRAAWRYDLGVPGAPEGVAMGTTPPGRVALRLDGRPADDLFTGRPAFERLPSDLLAPLFEAPGLYGAPAGVDAFLRAFAAEVPITELRYRAGPDDHQFIGVSHAQTRRPAFIQRIGGERARLGALVHVSGDRAGGEFTNASLSGFQLVGRITAALPGLAIEVKERHLRRTEGAWGGVDPSAPDPFVRTAPVHNSLAERQTIHNDLSVRVRATVLPLAEPLLAQLYWTAATHRFNSAATTEARGYRYGAVLGQPFTIGEHRLVAELDVRFGAYQGGNAFPGEEVVLPPELHLNVRDSVRLGGIDVVLEAGAHASQDFGYPSARIEVGRSGELLSAGLSAFAGGARLSPVERLGFGEEVLAGPLQGERILGVQATAGLTFGPLVAGATVEVSRRMRPRVLVLDDTLGGHFVTMDGELTRMAGTLELTFRATARRGLYAQTWVTAQRLMEAAESALHRREAEALPELYGYARLGARALGLFDGALDVDLFARGRAWSAHRGRVLHPPTALLGLAPPGASPVPARGVLDAVLEAGLGGGRATVFVAYQNALAGAAYPGVYLVPLYPLAEPRLRVGVFWVLAG